MKGLNGDMIKDKIWLGVVGSRMCYGYHVRAILSAFASRTLGFSTPFLRTQVKEAVRLFSKLSRNIKGRYIMAEDLL